jgi:hypothetical protein
MRGFELVERTPARAASFLLRPPGLAGCLPLRWHRLLRRASADNLGILHDSRRLPLYGKHYGRLLFLSCFMKSPERRRKVFELDLFMQRTSPAFCRKLESSSPVGRA